MLDIDKILQYSIDKGASDILLSVGCPVYYRVFGKLNPIGETLKQEDTISFLKTLLPEKRQRIMEENMDTDFLYELDSSRFRGSAYQTQNGVSVVLRLIPEKIPDFETLGVPSVVLDQVMKSKQGLILLVGPTGQGKSTTMASLLEHINVNKAEHLITFEDPIEYYIQSKKSIVDQRGSGDHVLGFSHGIRAALREDPDILMIGEMRDLDTISNAIVAAETGHLVFSTLHTESAYDTISRLIDAYPEMQQRQIRNQLAASLKMVVSQRLIPTVDGKGRVVACEIMINNYAISTYIREGDIFKIPNAMQLDSTGKMLLFEESLLELLKKGLISVENAFMYANDKNYLQSLLENQNIPLENLSKELLGG